MTKLINMKIIRGFTLVEIAVVLMILGLLLGGLLIPLSAQIDQQKIRVTQQRLEEIKEALIGFAILNRRLPCPASNTNGIETSGCNDNTEGFLPWIDLGIEKYDAWGRLFRYRADASYTTTFPTPSTPITPPVTTSKLEVQDNKESPTKFLTLDDGTSRVIAIIFSCGKNGLPNAENDDNGIVNNNATCTNSQTPNDSLYTQDSFVENQFDDILVWLPKTILINRLVASGRWPPS